MNYKYNREWLAKSIQNGLQPKYIFFWGHSAPHNEPVGKFVLSQWFESEFVLDGKSYKTAEHWMMANKAKLFNDKDAFEKIIASHKPGEVKALGRAVRNYNEATWNENKYDIVVRGNILKFEQSAMLKEFLLNTGDRIIVEASPVDKIWGIGLAQDNSKVFNPLEWRGENLLGFALMEARDFLRDNKS